MWNQCWSNHPSRLVLTLSLPLALACASKPETKPETPASAPAAAAPATASTSEATAEKLRAALAAPHRSDVNRARDVYRHPFETLSFFGLRDDMTVVELWPGGGWYTEVLAPVLKEKGKLIVTSFDPNGPEGYNTNNAKKLRELLDKNKEPFGNVQVAIVNPPEKVELAPPGSVDLIVTFRNFHGWASQKYADKILAAAFVALKPGGVLGVEDHRAKPGMDLKTGYIEESTVVEMAEAAGFKLAEKSEINANPKDTKDYPEGVWTLPPSLRLKDKDRDKYVAIGESDRFTLKFVKPGK